MERIGRISGVAVLAAFLAAAASGEEKMKPSDDFPQRSLTNGLVKLKLYLPAGEKGYYFGSRFEPSGVVARAEYKGHTFFGPWKQRDPNSQDSIMGTAEEFSMDDPPGFDEVEAGGVFYKIGVGELVRKEKPVKNKQTGKMEPQPYGFWRGHKVARRAPWRQTHGKDWVQFVQEFTGKRGWGWHYTKRVSLAKGAPSFTIFRRLENTGTKAIDTTHYCHNFTLIDNEPIGPNYEVRLPFNARAKQIKGDAAEVRDRQVVFLKPLLRSKSVWIEMEGMMGTALDNAVVIENRKTGASLKITGDRPVVTYRFWAAPLAACPEPFVAVKVAPRATITWSNTYTFHVRQVPKPK